MTRKYDGSRRAEAARRTREQIVAAAFRLHGQGILDLEDLAREADVSVATVRKHFPTREDLFQNCTAYGLHAAPMPDVNALGRVDDAVERTERAVREVYSLHESLLGQTWVAFQLEQESPVMAATLRQIEDVVSDVAEAVLEAWPADEASRASLRGQIAALLSPLTYRALRLHGGLSPSEAVTQTGSMLISSLSASTSERRLPITRTV